MLTTEQLIRMKEEKGLTAAQIAACSGVPAGTVGKILSGQTKKPRPVTMRAIERALVSGDFEGIGKEHLYAYQRRMARQSHQLREPAAPAYSYSVGRPEETRRGAYTLEEYDALPDDRRAELIDGVLYDMASPTTLHQELAQELWACLRDHIRDSRGSCRAFLAPLDVRFPFDNRTSVQPDVFVVCDRDKIKTHIEGAPDLVIEILSPATRRKDQIEKLHKYAQAGVREYWIVDPETERVVVHLLERDGDAFIYSFRDQIPVGIWDGIYEVDMERLYGEIRELYGKEQAAQS